ncbi:MAG: HAMP domain-containing histidine kinase [Erysipelotrichaceae bacterium]|nr:HAMP domain-containing histidine kinase [Erysipelotrichaceae bacterium]
MAKRIVVFLIAMFILASGTIAIWNSYGKAEQLAKEDSQISLRHNVAYELENNTSLRTLPYALKAEVDTQQEAFDSLLAVECEDSVIAQRIKGVFGTYYGYWKSHIYEYVNVHTYVKDNKTNQFSGTHPELANLSEEELTEMYQIVLKLNYDSHGLLTLDQYDLVDYYWENQFSEKMKTEIENYMSAEVREVIGEISYSEELFQLKLKPITDMEMIIAVPYELKTGDSLYYAGQMYVGHVFRQYLAVYSALVSAVVFALSLFLPLSVYKKSLWLQRLLNVKFEILAVALTLIIVPGMIMILHLADLTVYGDLAELIHEFQLSEWLNELTFALNTSVWLIYLCFVMFTALLIRWIWHKGLFRYLKENTCIAWVIGLVLAMIHWIMQLFERLLNFDLKDSINQLVIKIAGINLIVIVLLCCIFPAGILLAILYSLALFFFLRSKLRKIQSDYQEVLQMTQRLSDGNFNVSMEQDAGIFNSMKDSLGTLKIGFQKAVNEEVKSQKMKSELITNVSHDLKTPLTSIITYVDLLKNSESDEEKQQYIDTIDRASHRLKQLIEDLFEVSKVSSGNVSLNLVEADLIALITQVELECEEKLKEKQLDVKLQTSEEKIIMQLDSAKAFRIFDNLILNICKYAMKGTRVFINIEKNDTTVKVIFKNISEQELSFDPDEITERFVQGDKSRNAQGSGLGLAIVKSFTELHHGHFHIETDGDLFKAIVELPL